MWRRYVLRQLATVFAIITLSLTVAMWLIDVIDHLGYLINNDLPILDFLYFNALLLPVLSQNNAVVAAGLSTLFVYNRLANDRELTIMNSVGVGPMKIAEPALIFGCVLTAWLIFHFGYLTPVSMHEFRNMFHEISRQGLTLNLHEREFTPVADDLIVYIEEKHGRDEFSGVLLWDSRDQNRPVAAMAEEGRIVLQDDRLNFALVDGNRQEHDREEDTVDIVYFEQYSFDLEQFVEVTEREGRRDSERTLTELLEKFGAAAGDREKLKTFKYIQSHVVSAMSAFSAIAVGLVFLLFSLPNRRGQFIRVTAAVVFLLVLEAVKGTLNGMANTGWIYGYANIAVFGGLIVLSAPLLWIGGRAGRLWEIPDRIKRFVPKRFTEGEAT